MKKKILSTIILIMMAASHGETAANQESICFGTTANGRLENGVKLPSKGNNFRAYRLVLCGVGRTYIHSEVHKVIMNAYTSLEQTHSGKTFVYGETGLATGGDSNRTRRIKKGCRWISKSIVNRSNNEA